MADKTELPSNSSFLKCLQWAAKGGDSIQISHMGARDPLSQAIIYCLKKLGL